MDNKVFVGSVEIAEGQYGRYTKIGFSKKDLETMMTNLNERGYVNLTLSRSREGKPYITIYRPKSMAEVQHQANKVVQPDEPVIDPSDLPF